MKPVNSKSLFHLLCLTLEKLDNAEIDVATASATAKLVGQCNNLLNYELKRAVIMSNEDFAKNHRNLELKEFDSLS
jgi:hypothetical protein